MSKKRKRRTLQRLAEEILGELHEIDQKVEHIIKRLPKNGHHPHDHQCNHFFD
jgi:predicted oxidoreductase (fatty acid repression mutant protein)